MMTLRRLAALADRVRSSLRSNHLSNLMVVSNAIAQRAQERGPSKLARRMRRKRELGLAGAF